MNTIQNFIQAAKDRRVQEILLGPDKPIQFRIGRDLVSANGKELSVTDSKNLVAQILNEDEKKSLYQDLKVQGFKNLEGVSFRFDFQIDFTGIRGSLQITSDVAKSWNFPQSTADSLMRPQGLHILTGPRRSGKSTAIADLMTQSRIKNRTVACFVEDENQILSFNNNLNVAQFPIDQLDKNNIPRSADVIIIDTAAASYCEKSLSLAEQGYNVLLSLPFWNIEMALERFLDLSAGNQDAKARRLGSVLQWAIGVQLMPSLDMPLCGAYELLSVNADIQKLLRAERLAAVTQAMNDKSEKLGMRTMNQSLFQLLIKRKIEWKTAFELSPAPEELDQILRKVGV